MVHDFDFRIIRYVLRYYLVQLGYHEAWNDLFSEHRCYALDFRKSFLPPESLVFYPTPYLIGEQANNDY